MKKVKIPIVGMHCASCAQKIEATLNRMNGVKAYVNFAAEKALVEFDETLTNEKEIKNAIEQLGYKVIGFHEEETLLDREKEEREKEIKELWHVFFVSFVFSIPVFFFSVLDMLNIHFNFPFKEFFIVLCATVVQFYGGYRFYKGAYNAFKAGNANMDTLVSIGTTAAYFYSLFILFFPSTEKHLYFDTSTIIITFILLGKFLEAKVKGKTSEAIKKLIGLQPKTAVVIRKNKETEIPVEEVNINDIVIVKPGQKIPVDGVVIHGNSFVDESIITGESMPVEKKKGSFVIAGSINKHGFLKIKATKVGKETMLNQIIKLVEEAQLKKPQIQKLADKISGIFAYIVIFIALFSFITWHFIFNKPFSFALSIAIAILIIACPCALGLATPLAVLAGTTKAAQNGILIKNPEVLEKIENVDVIVFDKTGTLTVGKPFVTDVIAIEKGKEKEVLKYAAIAEKLSEHPIAEAILKKAKEEKIKVEKPKSFKAIPGYGVVALYKDKVLVFGNIKLMKKKGIKIENIEKEIENLQNEGKTVAILAVNKKVFGIIAISDVLKENAKNVVERLEEMGKKVIMLTGDNKRSAMAIAKSLGIKKVLYEVLPQDKGKEIEKLQKKGYKVAMIGDGINDAIALSKADVSIAVAKATDIAIESADIVLVKDDVKDIIKAIDISSYTLKKIKQNLFWAFFYNITAIPIAAGLIYPFTGILLNPAIAAAAMAFSSISVVLNSFLMLSYKPKG